MRGEVADSTAAKESNTCERPYGQMVHRQYGGLLNLYEVKVVLWEVGGP
jgi:hypothetical protein